LVVTWPQFIQRFSSEEPSEDLLRQPLSVRRSPS
jgi:hypothetical protein